MEACLGLLESKTIARGIEAADAMTKEASIALFFVRAIEPGRQVTLVSGPVEDVRLALRRGRAVLAEDLVEELFLPGAHPSILDAIATARSRLEGFAQPAALFALGLVECATVASTLLAADAAAKEARVRLAAVRFGADMGGKGLVAVLGEVSDVEAAVAKAAFLAEERATLVRTAVIANPNEPLIERVLNV
jgi:microcompartment protein CcmL/EutN